MMSKNKNFRYSDNEHEFNGLQKAILIAIAVLVLVLVFYL